MWLYGAPRNCHRSNHQAPNAQVSAEDLLGQPCPRSASAIFRWPFARALYFFDGAACSRPSARQTSVACVSVGQKGKSRFLVVLFSVGTAVMDKMFSSQAQLLDDDSAANDGVVRKQQAPLTMGGQRSNVILLWYCAYSPTTNWADVIARVPV